MRAIEIVFCRGTLDLVACARLNPCPIKSDVFREDPDLSRGVSGRAEVLEPPVSDRVRLSDVFREDPDIKKILHV